MKKPTVIQLFIAHSGKLIVVFMLGVLCFLTLPAMGLGVPHDTDNGRVVQLDLAKMPKISQFNDINSSVNGYGKNACGLVAAAAAVGGENWVTDVSKIASAAGDTYSADSGIQPSDYVRALTLVYGQQNVKALNASSLDTLYQELYNGNIVIVDLKVNVNSNVPSAEAPNFAHFARVVGIDKNSQEIYIENTLRGAAYWTVPFDDFVKAWEHPETTASKIPDVANAESVTNWAVVLDSSLVPDQDL